MCAEDIYQYGDIEIVFKSKKISRRSSADIERISRMHRTFEYISVVEKRNIVKTMPCPKRVVHIQKRLKDVVPSPVDIVFRAEELLESGNLDIKRLIHGLCKNFPLYNLDKAKMIELVEIFKKTYLRKKKVIIPKELLSLALLNRVDGILQKENMANFFKTKYIDDLSMGRRVYGARFLHENNYIIERGRVWERTDKEFDQMDFWHMD